MTTTLTEKERTVETINACIENGGKLEIEGKRITKLAQAWRGEFTAEVKGRKTSIEVTAEQARALVRGGDRPLDQHRSAADGAPRRWRDARPPVRSGHYHERLALGGGAEPVCCGCAGHTQEGA